ncbi:hypothetical protein [Pseudomonas sp. NPDC089401]|uniref:hypothetical protein n=1 Tax=Pseudomonas sp. NPDC089401 TaxID=3364462 RepID=UPI00380D0E2E
MSCLICAGHAESIDCLAGWEERKCAQCGCYRMSQALILSMMDEGQIFDAEKMRQWLQLQRSVEAIPTIAVHEAILVQ